MGFQTLTSSGFHFLYRPPSVWQWNVSTVLLSRATVCGIRLVQGQAIFRALQTRDLRKKENSEPFFYTFGVFLGLVVLFSLMAHVRRTKAGRSSRSTLVIGGSINIHSNRRSLHSGGHIQREQTMANCSEHVMGAS